MKPEYYLVLVTAPNRTTARKLARGALLKRLVACANLVPGVESHYWWENRLDRANEILIFFKTHKEKLTELEQWIVSEHPYDTPEFVALQLKKGNARYLKWISESVMSAMVSAGKS